MRGRIHADGPRQIIMALGYPLPDARDVPANEIETACTYFIWKMSATDKNANHKSGHRGGSR